MGMDDLLFYPNGCLPNGNMVIWVKQWISQYGNMGKTMNHPFGNGKHTTYKNGEVGNGWWHCFPNIIQHFWLAHHPVTTNDKSRPFYLFYLTNTPGLLEPGHGENVHPMGGSFRCGASKSHILYSRSPHYSPNIRLRVKILYPASSHIDIAGTWIIYPNMIEIKYLDRFWPTIIYGWGDSDCSSFAPSPLESLCPFWNHRFSK